MLASRVACQSSYGPLLGSFKVWEEGMMMGVLVDGKRRGWQSFNVWEEERKGAA